MNDPIVSEYSTYGASLSPPVLAVEVNDRCASRCGHCSYGHARLDAPPLSLDRLLGAVRDAHAYGSRVLTVAAREPFLPGATGRTIAVLQTATEVGYESLAAITSARFLPTAREALAKAGLRLASLDVSVDGLGTLHDRLRGVHEWQAIESGLAPGAYDDVTRSLCASITLQRGNAAEIIDLLDWLADGPRVNAALIATVSMNGLNDPDCALLPGQFSAALQAIEHWYQERRPPEMELALELTPDSVPEICSLARDGTLDPEAVGLGPYGFPFLRLASGLPVRVVTGIFSLGRVLRIEASGRARLSYDDPQGIGAVPAVDLRHARLRDWLPATHRSGKVLSVATAAAERRPEALACPAWPFHLDRCPSHPAEQESSHA